MATFERVLQELVKLHGQATSQWFMGTGIKSSKLEVLESGGDSGFSKQNNMIRIYVADGNLEDWNPDELPFEHTIFYLELSEELIHEYQYKLLPKSSPTSDDLHRRFGRFFGTSGHGVDFFAAIEATASFFDKTPKDLARFLSGPQSTNVP